MARSQELAHAASERCAAIARTTPDGFWLLDSDCRFLDVNDAYCRLTGYARDELIGRTISAVEASERPEETARRVAHVRTVGHDRFETQHRRRDGTLADVEVSASCLPLDGGRLVVFVRDLSASKLLERKALAAERLLRGVMGAITESALLISPDGVVLMANESVARRVGRTVAEMTGRVIYDFIPPALAETRREQIQAAIRARAPVQFDDMRFGRSVRNSILPLLDSAGQVSHVAIFGYDLTERRQAEESLALSLSLLSSSDDAILALDPATRRILEVNDTACKRLGYDRAELLRMGAEDVDPSFPSISWDRHLESLRQTGARVFETVHRQKSGAVFPVEISLRCITVGDREYLVASARDISRRRGAEAEVRRLTERIQMATRAAGIGIWDWDVPGNRLVWDDQMYRLYGIAQDQFNGAYEAWEAGLHPDDRERSRREVQDALAGARDFDSEFRVVWPDGSVHTLKAFALVQRDHAGAPLRMLGTNWDTTARTRAETALHEQSERLAEANRELEAFSYSVSHDLRAPLRHVSGFVDILREHLGPGLDDTARRHMDTIERAARQMGTLIDELLAFSRMGREELQRRMVPLSALVREAQDEIGVEPDRNIEWSVSPLPDVPGDRPMLKQVLLNLLGNALKYTRPRPIARIEVGATVSADEVVVHVRDNGVGFDMKYADRLFGVFQRLHRAEEFEGTGIGLANVRRVITRHGGRTWAESEPDRGATFFFSLPATKRDPP